MMPWPVNYATTSRKPCSNAGGVMSKYNNSAMILYAVFCYIYALARYRRTQSVVLRPPMGAYSQNVQKLLVLKRMLYSYRCMFVYLLVYLWYRSCCVATAWTFRKK